MVKNKKLNTAAKAKKDEFYTPIVQTELNFFGTPNENPNFDKKKSAIRFDVSKVRDFNGDGVTDLADVKWLFF